MKLYPYQKKHVSRLISILKKEKGAFDLSPTGTGKTICALSAAKALGVSSIKVVAPLAALPGWRNTAKALRLNCEAVNYEMLSKHEHFFKKSPLVVYDEAHRCKNHSTKNAQNMLRIAGTGARILALSATLAHHAENLRAWNEAFGFRAGNTFSGFMKRAGYFWNQTRWGGEWIPYDAEKSAVLTRSIIEPFSSAMTLEEAARFFKDNFVTVEVISSKDDEKLKAVYESTFKKLRAGDRTSQHLTEILRARQASEKVKTAYVSEAVRDVVDQGFSAVVFCNFNDTIDTLAETLRDLNPAQIRGGQAPLARETQRTLFQTGKTHVILCNTASGGTALDLHDLEGRPRYSFLFPSWSASDLKQALGRIHRAGSKSAAVQKIIYSDIPVERKIARVVESKLRNLEILNSRELDVMEEGR